MSNFLRRLATGIRDFVYNVTRGHYESADGQAVPEERVIAAVERRQDDGAQVVTALVREYVNGEITVREWQDMFAIELRRMHLQSFAAGRGGWDRITVADRRIIEQRVRDELLFLRQFADDLKSENLSEAQIKARMQMYVEHVRASYWQGQTEAQKQAGKREEMRVLNPAEHCNDCVALAGHWEPIGTLPAPGDGSQCGGRCKCGKVYR